MSDITPEDTFGDSKKTLYNLIEKGSVKMIEELLQLGTDVNLKFENGAMPLHVAALNEQKKTAKLLISYEADVNAQDGNGNTPIFHATKNGDLEMAELLLANGADVKDYPELLNNAVENDHVKLVEVLLKHGADVNCKDIFGGTALLTTALDKHILEDLFDPDHADIRGEIAKLLLSWGANANDQTKNGYTALESAVESGFVKVVEALLEYKAKINPAALGASARSGIAAITEMLLNNGADVNATLQDGMTALHIAALEGHVEVLEVLLRGGAKVNSKTNMDVTPLHLAAMHLIRSPLPSTVAKILLAYGAEVDCKDKSGKTALHIASQNGRTEIVVDLLNYGSDINIKNKDSQTPLFCAGVDCFTRRLLVSYTIRDDNYIHSRRIYAWEATVEILKRQVIKLKTAKLYVTKENLQSIGSKDELTNFQNDCEKELADIKMQKIDNTNVSYYDILTKDINQLALIARNEDVMRVFRSGYIGFKFQRFGSMIESNIRKGNTRKELLEQNHKFFQILMNILPGGIPNTCVENIFCYFDNEDLRILIEACEPANIGSSNNI